MSHVHLQTGILASAPTRVRNVPTARALRRLVGGVGDDARGGHPRPSRLVGKQNAEAEGAQQHDADEHESRTDAEVDSVTFDDGHP